MIAAFPPSPSGRFELKSVGSIMSEIEEFDKLYALYKIRARTYDSLCNGIKDVAKSSKPVPAIGEQIVLSSLAAQEALTEAALTLVQKCAAIEARREAVHATAIAEIAALVPCKRASWIIADAPYAVSGSSATS